MFWIWKSNISFSWETRRNNNKNWKMFKLLKNWLW